MEMSKSEVIGDIVRLIRLKVITIRIQWGIEAGSEKNT